MRTLKHIPFSWILSLSLCSLTAGAQTWPTKPIKLITSAAPGGIVDITPEGTNPICRLS
jgi:tripartite-type tricarboxylate transporter receptor subunit TctC